MNFILTILYVVGLYGAYAAGFLYVRNQSKTFRFPRLTILLLFAIVMPSILQFFYPALLPAFQRDPVRFFHGEWWRLVTPLFVQDGGISGMIFNLVSLLFVGTITEQLWTSREVLLLFIVGAIFGEIVAFAWQPIGAGNSVGNFSLAASIAVFVLMKSQQKPLRIISSLAIGVYIALLVLKDIHGAASIAGMVLAYFMVKQTTYHSSFQPKS